MLRIKAVQKVIARVRRTDEVKSKPECVAVTWVDVSLHKIPKMLSLRHE